MCRVQARDRLMTFLLGSRASFNMAKKEVVQDCPVPYRNYMPAQGR